MTLLIASLVLTAAAEPVEPYEEVVVIAEKNAWDGARWRVRAEVELPGAVALQGPEAELALDTWTLDWVLRCELRGLRHAACAVEDVALSVVGSGTPVEADILRDHRDRLAALTVHVPFDGDDEAGVVDVVGLGSDDGLATVVDLAMRAFRSPAPDDGFEDGALWWRGRDPMLALPGFTTVVSRSDVHHVGARREGWTFVRSVGRISVAETEVPDDVDVPEAMQVVRGGRVVPGRAHVGAHLTSTTWYDVESGFLNGRDVHVEGFLRPVRLDVQVRRLDAFAEVSVGPSGFVPEWLAVGAL